MLPFDDASFRSFPSTAFIFQGIKHQSGIFSKIIQKICPRLLVPVEDPGLIDRMHLQPSTISHKITKTQTYFTFASFFLFYSVHVLLRRFLKQRCLSGAKIYGS